MCIRKLLLGAVPVLCAIAAGLFGSASAYAKEVHIYNSTFASKGSGPGQLEKPTGIAVNDSTEALLEPAAGDVYVVDQANDRVERFSATGTPLGWFNGGGTYENTEAMEKVKHDTPAPTGALSDLGGLPIGIAVDNSGKSAVEDPSTGDVYVIDRGHNVIDKFTATGEYLAQLTGAPSGAFEHEQILQEPIQGVAVDPSGVLWVQQDFEYYARHEYQFNVFYITSFSDASANAYISTRRSQFGSAAYGGLGVDAGDNFYLRLSQGTFVELNSSAETLSNPFGGDKDAESVAVDARAGEVFLDNSESVEAFSVAGASLETFGAGYVGESRGVAVNESDGTVYVTNATQGTVAIFEGVSAPAATVSALSDQRPRSVTLNGSVTPEGKPVSSCEFEYVEASDYEANASNPYVKGAKVACEPASLGQGSTPVPVSAQLKGLAPGTTYHYRLIVENAAHIVGASPDETFVAGPIFGGEFVDDVTSSSATPRAVLDPNGAPTSYYFEYGTSVAYGAVAPVGGASAGSGASAAPVSVHLQGLQPGIGYHYRLVVVQGGENFSGPDRMFSTQSTGGSNALIDGRQWELVSPVDKHGGLIELFEDGGQVQAAADGSGIAYMTGGGSAGGSPAGKHEFDQVLSRRGPGGWSTEDLTLPERLPETGMTTSILTKLELEYRLFSPNLSLSMVEPQVAGTPLLSPEATERTLYLRDDSNGGFLPLVTPSDVPTETKIEESTLFLAESASPLNWEMHFLASTPDLAHVVFDSPMALTPEATQEESIEGRVQKGESGGNKTQRNLYEWGDGELQLVNILPETDQNEVSHAPGEVAHGRAPIVRLAGSEENSGLPRGSVQRAMSSDGRRVAWTWGEPYNGNEEYRGVYVRDMVEERTVKVGGPHAVYQTMNSEGTRIFYLESGDLYAYDFETGVATDLTTGHGSGEANAGVQEVVSDVSEEGSYVYFVATGVLAEGGVGGAYNLYVLHDTGEGWTTAHIATLSPEDDMDWYAQIFSAPNISEITSRVSPDGRYLVFMSNRSLTGYDNTDALSGEPDEEVYEYDARAGRLVCVSCDPTGARPAGVEDGGAGAEPPMVDRDGILRAHDTAPNQNGRDGERFNHWLAGSVPGWDNLDQDPATYQPRYLSDSGRVFFDSPVGLVPQDTNKLEDAYEWEPEGVGGCTSATSSLTAVYVGEIVGSVDGGCVGLISSGTAGTESAFYDASENGNDVFFDTTAKLSGEDIDKAYDLYDAHVCTSEVPCKAAPVAPPPCGEGESCKASPSPQPEIFGAPPSATFKGAGNVAPAPIVSAVKKAARRKPRGCKRGFVKRRSRCVRQAKKKAKAKKLTRRAK